jgi:hypothetical protein
VLMSMYMYEWDMVLMRRKTSGILVAR